MIGLEVGRLFNFYVKHEILGVGRGTKDYVFPARMSLPDTKPAVIRNRKGSSISVIDLSKAPEGPQHAGPVDPEKLLAELDRIKANFQGVVMLARRI
ncbi:hypothetical protein HYT74_03380 [Candidatus Daviesbacteria bacterium]|nr:hypothetical protein [Candidatus Daviesbacteria bacterium]